MSVKRQDIFVCSMRIFLITMLLQSYALSADSKMHELSEKLRDEPSKDLTITGISDPVRLPVKKTKVSTSIRPKKPELDRSAELDSALNKRRNKVDVSSRTASVKQENIEEPEYHYESSDASEQDFRLHGDQTPAKKPVSDVKKQSKDIDDMWQRFQDLQKQAQDQLDKSYRLEAFIQKAFAAKTVSTIPLKLKSMKDVLLSLSPLIFNIELKKTWFTKQGALADASDVDAFIRQLLARETELKDLCKRWDSDLVQLQLDSQMSKPNIDIHVPKSETEEHVESDSDTTKQQSEFVALHDLSSDNHSEQSMLNVKEDLDDIKGKLDEIMGKFDEIKSKLKM